MKAIKHRFFLRGGWWRIPNDSPSKGVAAAFGSQALLESGNQACVKQDVYMGADCARKRFVVVPIDTFVRPILQRWYSEVGRPHM